MGGGCHLQVRLKNGSVSPRRPGRSEVAAAIEQWAGFAAGPTRKINLGIGVGRRPQRLRNRLRALGLCNRRTQCPDESASPQRRPHVAKPDSSITLPPPRTAKQEPNRPKLSRTLRYRSSLIFR
ncbi:unnamed protein product, partial [Iphiclides podalirius]